MEIHIGSLIRKRLDEKGNSVVWLARQLACSRTNVYKIFEKAHLDTDMLARISVVLEYDFFILLSKSLREVGQPNMAAKTQDYN